MELGLSLGEAPVAARDSVAKVGWGFVGLGFGMGLGVGVERGEGDREDDSEERSSGEPSLQLNLCPLTASVSWPARRRFPWAAPEKRNFESSMVRGFDVNRPALADEVEEGAAAASSSPNSTVSSFQMEFSAYRHSIQGDRTAVVGCGVPAAVSGELERTSSRASDEEENGAAARKKLRLSKEQSAFLEESFKEHNTLNPKQKLALAKQLNLRPRQVEVWFQNRRARTKLKQTELDCEYLKRCCETLTEENRRLQKELAELRALKTAQPFYMHLPATTLSMCPSCERVASANAAANASSFAAAAASTSSSALATAAAGVHRPNSFAALFSKPRPFQFANQTIAQPHQPSATS